MQDVVAITGGAGGVGTALTNAFAAAGYRVAVLSNTNPARAQALVQQQRDQGRDCIHMPCDVTQPAAVNRAFDEIQQRFGENVSILVNNAGGNLDASVRKMDAERWSAVLSVHLDGAFNCARAALEPMTEQGFGRIINVSSVVAATGVAGASNYAAAKAGIEGFTRSLAKEVARFGVTVNAVALGYFELGLGLKLLPAVREHVEARIPLGRFGRASEIPGLFLYLASPGASYLTGAVLPITGGMP